VSRPKAIDRLQKKIKAEKEPLIWEKERSKTLTGWDEIYEDWYWEQIKEGRARTLRRFRSGG